MFQLRALRRSSGVPAAVTEAPSLKSIIRHLFVTLRNCGKEMLKTRDLAMTSILLVGIWFAVALTYYGMIMFTNTVQVSDGRCMNHAAVLMVDDYRDIFITTLGEVRRPASHLDVQSGATG
jgi:hypothetical protein